MLLPLRVGKSDNFHYSDKCRDNNQYKIKAQIRIEAKKIKSDNFRRSNREKYNIAMSILGNKHIDITPKK